MFRLSVITDEVSQDLQAAIEFAEFFELQGVELRSVYDKDPFDWTRDDVAKMAALTKSAGLEVCCLSLPFFKCEIDDMVAREAHMAGLRRALSHADTLGCRIVRGFNFWRRDNLELPVDRIVEAYEPVVSMLREAGMTLGLEIEPSVYAASAQMVRDVVEAIGAPEVRALWDGGNLLWSTVSEPPMMGYDILRDLIAHVHVKDAIGRGDSARAVRIGTGVTDIAGQLKRLSEDGYDGFVSLETHYRLDRALMEEVLRSPAGADFSKGGYAASFESMQSLRQIAASIG